jgi:transposase InsO family protein
MDFVADQLGNGVRFSILIVVDIFTRQALAVEAGSRLRGEHVVAVLNRLVVLRGAPKTVFVDNGSEFTGRLMDMCAHHHRVRLDFSRPGQAYGQLLRGDLQRVAARRVPERQLVCVAGRDQASLGGLEKGLQRGSPSQFSQRPESG